MALGCLPPSRGLDRHQPRSTVQPCRQKGAWSYAGAGCGYRQEPHGSSAAAATGSRKGVASGCAYTFSRGAGSELLHTAGHSPVPWKLPTSGGCLRPRNLAALSVRQQLLPLEKPGDLSLRPHGLTTRLLCSSHVFV